jgi:hypothetical protein
VVCLYEGEDQKKKTRIAATPASSPATPAATSGFTALATHGNNNIARATTAMAVTTTPSTQHFHQHFQQQCNNLNFNINIHVIYVDQPQQRNDTTQHNATQRHPQYHLQQQRI